MARARGADKRAWTECLQCWQPGTSPVKVPPGTGPIYKHWHEAIEAKIAAGSLRRESAPSNRLIYFDCNAFHQGTAAIGGGFRWFGRVSWDTQRAYANEVRNQTQVYLPLPMEGW